MNTSSSKVTDRAWSHLLMDRNGHRQRRLCRLRRVYVSCVQRSMLIERWSQRTYWCRGLDWVWQVVMINISAVESTRSWTIKSIELAWSTGRETPKSTAYLTMVSKSSMISFNNFDLCERKIEMVLSVESINSLPRLLFSSSLSDNWSFPRRVHPSSTAFECTSQSVHWFRSQANMSTKQNWLNRTGPGKRRSMRKYRSRTLTLCMAIRAELISSIGTSK